MSWIANVVANLTTKLRKNVLPRILKGTLDEVVPANRDRCFAGVLHKPWTQFTRIRVHMVRETLRDKQPDHIRRKNERSMIRKCQIHCRNEGVKANAFDKLTAIA